MMVRNLKNLTIFSHLREQTRSMSSKNLHVMFDFMILHIEQNSWTILEYNHVSAATGRWSNLNLLRKINRSGYVTGFNVCMCPIDSTYIGSWWGIAKSEGNRIWWARSGRNKIAWLFSLQALQINTARKMNLRTKSHKT